MLRGKKWAHTLRVSNPRTNAFGTPGGGAVRRAMPMANLYLSGVAMLKPLLGTSPSLQKLVNCVEAIHRPFFLLLLAGRSPSLLLFSLAESSPPESVCPLLLLRAGDDILTSAAPPSSFSVSSGVVGGDRFELGRFGTGTCVSPPAKSSVKLNLCQCNVLMNDAHVCKPNNTGQV